MAKQQQHPAVEMADTGPLHGKLSLTGYDLPHGLTYDEWADEGPTLVMMARASMFWLGDWVQYGEHAYGEKYAQAVEVTGLAVQTLKNAAWVCDRIPPAERNPDVPFSHHRAVAALEPRQRRALLKEAAAEGHTEFDVRRRVREIKEAEAVPASETVVITQQPSRAEVLAGATLEALIADAAVNLDAALAHRDWDHVVEAHAAVVEAGKRLRAEAKR